MDYTTHVNPRRVRKITPQSQAIPDKEMVENTAGGFSFEVSDWDKLDRFLVLGTEGGTYYVGEKKLTKESAKSIQSLIEREGVRVVRRVVEISDSGRAPKNDPALFVLAMASAASDLVVRKAALNALPKVARIGTHLFHFAQFVEAFRGWGRALRKAIAGWYNEKELGKLEYQVMKYKQRDGWSHRDLLRLAHPVADSDERNLLYKFIVNKDSVDKNKLSDKMQAAEQLSVETDVRTAVKLIDQFNLPREVVNTELLKSKKVWEVLLRKMPLTAMIRNLGKMTSIDLLKPMSNTSSLVVDTVTNQDILHNARVHPLAILVALKTYEQGHGHKGNLSWIPIQEIVDALDEAFYLAFDNVKPTGKRFLLGLDISASMSWGNISGMPGITPAVGAAAMSLITAKVEKKNKILGFADSFRELGISSRMRLDDVIRKTANLSFGGTDCSLPMLYALQNKIDVDAFIVYTDSETWAGRIHPVQALQQYRDRTGIPAKLIVVGMQANDFTIADPNDSGMLDIAGFDTAVPQIMNSFIQG